MPCLLCIYAVCMYVGHIENYVCQSYCICKSSKDARVALRLSSVVHTYRVCTARNWAPSSSVWNFLPRNNWTYCLFHDKTRLKRNSAYIQDPRHDYDFQPTLQRPTQIKICIKGAILRGFFATKS